MHLWAWIIGGAIVVLGAWLRLYPLVAARRWHKLDKAPRPPQTNKEERRRGMLFGIPFGAGMLVVGAAVGLMIAFVTGNIALAFALGILGSATVMTVGIVVAFVAFRDELFDKKPPHSE